MTPYFKTLFLLILLTTTAPQPIHSVSISISQYLSLYRSLLSLFHSLLMRVANLRAERGDISGANRAKLFAQKLEPVLGLGFLRFSWSVGWDYAKTYEWRELDYRDLYGAVSDLNDLRMRFDSDPDKATWIRRNYGDVLEVSKRLFVGLLGVFRQYEALREVVETVQIELVEGGLLRDCLVVGSNDLKGLLVIFETLFSQYFSTPHHDHEYPVDARVCTNEKYVLKSTQGLAGSHYLDAGSIWNVKEKHKQQEHNDF